MHGRCDRAPRRPRFSRTEHYTRASRRLAVKCVVCHTPEPNRLNSHPPCSSLWRLTVSAVASPGRRTSARLAPGAGAASLLCCEHPGPCLKCRTVVVDSFYNDPDRACRRGARLRSRSRRGRARTGTTHVEPTLDFYGHGRAETACVHGPRARTVRRSGPAPRPRHAGRRAGRAGSDAHPILARPQTS